MNWQLAAKKKRFELLISIQLINSTISLKRNPFDLDFDFCENVPTLINHDASHKAILPYK